MYRIIGADGKEYGPINLEQLRQWIAEGRASGQTRIREEGSTEWKIVSDLPEIGAPPTIAPPSGMAPLGPIVPALDQVSGPAVGLIIVGALDIALSLFRMVGIMAGFGLGAMQATNPMQQRIMAIFGSAGIVLAIVELLVGGLILFGGLKMRRLENYGLCVAASILVMIPILSCCCIVGVPIGIWALVVISKPEVKSAFH